MSLLQQLTPLNLQEEKQKFFADQTYNPQFVYAESVDKEKLKKYLPATPELIAIAERILAKSIASQDGEALEQDLGKIISQKDVTKKAQLFLKMHKLDRRFEVIWSASFLSRATMGQTALKLKTTSEFREKETIGLLYHEIGTHAIRNYNYEQQAWYRKKSKFDLQGNYLETEEGLAVLHSLLPLKNKLLTKSAIRYLATHKTTELSFSQLWQYLKQYIADEEERWTAVVRQKRGLSDSSQPGIYMKDGVYFSGAIKILAWLQTNNFALENLYLGKIGIEDLENIAKIQGNAPPLLPSFYILDQSKYKEKILEIARANEL